MLPVRTLAHLSDLHIGESEERDDAARALCDALLKSAVDHVVVTGDLTHEGSYREMLRFEQLFAPVLSSGRMTVVPGPSDRLGDNAGAYLMRAKRVAVARKPDLYLVRVDTTGLPVRPDAPESARVLVEVDAALEAAPMDSLRVLLLHHPLPQPSEERSPGAPTLGARLIALARGRCDLVLHGHHRTPGEFQLLDEPRPLAVYNAGSSTELLRFRIFTHEHGRQVQPPRWLSAEARVRAAAVAPRVSSPEAVPAARASPRRASRESAVRAPVTSTSTSTAFRFALPPSLGTRLAEERSQRLQRHLSAALDQPVEISIATSYEMLARELANGRLGAAWAPPFVCARVENLGVRVLVRGVRRGASTYRAALVCRADARQRVVKWEPGLTALWVDRDSVAGYLLPLAHLRSRGLDPGRIFMSQDFTGTYQAAVEGVLSGKADVTSVFASAASRDRPDHTGLEEISPGRERELAVLGYTDETPTDGVAVGSSTPPEVCAALEQSLLGMQDNLMGVGLLKSAFNVERFEKAPPRGYRALYRVALAGV